MSQRLDHDSFVFRTIYDCSRDQWDIYMLDPAYTCVYKPDPEICSIRPNPNYMKNPRPEPLTSKRSLSPVNLNGDNSSSHTHKKRRIDPEAEEDEVEQLLSSEPPNLRPKPSRRSSSRSRQPAPTIITQPPLEPVQELHDTDMEDLANTPVPKNSQSTASEKRKGMFRPSYSAKIPHASTQMQMRCTARAHSDQASACEQNW